MQYNAPSLGRYTVILTNVNKPKMMMLKKISAFLMLILCCYAVNAKPYMPTDMNAVLEQLPINADLSSANFKALRTQLNANPTNVNLATELARLYIERARDEGDPRYLGYAQAALTPWWNLDQPPIAVIVLRATLFQSTHQFNQALKDLDTALKLDSNNGQAWITRATILQVQGEYAQALKSCEHLYALAPALITLTCVANVRNLNGDALKSYQDLKLCYQQAADKPPAIQVWVLTLLAEMAVRLGNTIAADQTFQQAIKIEKPDSYLLGAYSDFLLDQNRPQEVIKLLKDKTNNDALLLRYAEALKNANAIQAEFQIQSLQQRFAAAMLRADTVHQREQSRFELRLMHNPVKALAIAKLNWQVQKEPADARVYLEAAVAANDKNAVATMVNWLATSHLQDAALQKISDRTQHK